MACTLTKDKVTKEFMDKGALSPSNSIMNKHKFDLMNSQYSKMFNQKLSLGKLEKLFEVDGKKAIANEELFNAIDDAMYSPSLLTDKKLDIKEFSNKMIDDSYKEFYSKLNGIDEYVEKLSDNRVDSIATVEDKIAYMEQSFDAKVIVDNELDGPGMLLASNHPISRVHNKPVIVINPELAFSDVVFHEFGHLYIEMLGGIENQEVYNAIELLRESTLWDKVAKKYPELSEQDLGKEVLATALGIEGNNIYENSTKETIWQRIKNAFIRAIDAMFGNSRGYNAIEQLASKMIDSSIKKSSTLSYNSLIDQNRKLYIDDPTPANIDKFFKGLTDKYKLREEDHVYINQETNEVHDKSSSALAKNLSPGSSNHNKKGYYEIDLDEEFTLTKDNWKRIFSESRIPWSLDQALTEYFDGELSSGLLMSNKDEAKSWYTFYMEKQADVLLADIDDDIVRDLEVINDRAKEIEYSKSLSTMIGNDVHEALENYINNFEDFAEDEYPFPGNIQDTENLELFKSVSKIIREGKKNGSKFYTEQVLFNETSKTPGTADLIEITKEGKFRIYDFKTTKSFKYRGEPKSDYMMYIYPGYLNQLIIYSTMLEDYNLEPAENHLNIISMEIDRSEYDPKNDQNTIKINQVISRNLNPNSKSLSTHYNYAKNKVLDYLMSPDKLSDLGIENREETAEAIALRIQRALKDYKDLTNSRTGKFKDDTINSNREIYQLEEDIKELIGTNNALVMYRYIENMRDALLNVYQETSANDQVLSASYVKNINYLVQASSFIENVSKFIDEANDDYLIGNVDKQEIVELLNETKDAVSKVTRIHDLHSRILAVRTLAKNSNHKEGYRIEFHELEARKAGKTKPEEISEHVQKAIKKEKDLIRRKETQYWDNMLTNGYIDIRNFEYQLADPGMNKSQFVQVVKNILDKVDNDIRIELDKSIPEIVKWHKDLDFKTTGDPKEVWKGMFNIAKYKDLNGKTVTYQHGSLISETTSVYRKAFLKHYYKIEYLKREINKAFRDNNNAKVEKLEELIKKQEETRNDELAELREDPNNLVQVTNPDFAKLDSGRQEALRFAKKKLEEADERLYAEPTKRLVFTLGDDTKIHNIPKMRMTHYEAAYDMSGAYNRFKSGISELWSPSQDEDELNLGKEEMGVYDDTLKTKNTDIVGDPSFNVPVFYRNPLEDPTLQSFDLPTLLAMNEETTISYQEHKLVEADLYMITGALENSKALKTDSMVSKGINDSVIGKMTKSLQSEDNKTLKAVRASINNRFYKRAYSGTYSKWNYRLIKGLEKVGGVTSAVLLGGNFRSATMTGLQGSIYRFIEGVAGENFSLADVTKGSKKSWGDISAIIQDSQSQFPTSKTNLLIRRFGLETQYKALVNKFVQDNVVTKNLDQGSLFAVTTIAETLVTANLMYTLLSNIKVMNKDGDYINKSGKVVSKEAAMSLDEAYEVKDGVLELNKHVTFTERNLNSEFKHHLKGEKTGASTEISRYIRSIYADLYGQYNQDMKSVVEMNIYGKLAMSMRKWIPRGYHRRWRGTGSLLSGYTFEELHKEENSDMRFYSQDQKKFQEGYYVTGLRYGMSIIKQMKQNELGLAAAAKQVKSTMTTHELANLKRTASETALIALSFAAAMMLRSLAQSLDDDDRSNDKLYYALYIMERIKMETFTFINPAELLDNLKNPAASVNTLTRLRKLFQNLVGFTFDENGDMDWNINNEYETGLRKGDLKIEKSIQQLIPFYKNWEQFKGIFGYDSDETIKTSYEYMTRPL